MRKRRLGRTDYQVSEIGYGTWGLGGGRWCGVSSDEARQSLVLALESGVDFIDTALAYNAGRSERVVGDVVGELGMRDSVVIATKIPPKNRTWPASLGVGMERVFPSEHVVDSVDRSLRNLQIEALDLQQLHVWHDAWLGTAAWDDFCATMDKLIEAGKVRHVGISIAAHDPDSAILALEQPLISTVQAIYNIYDRSCERSLFTRAREYDVGVIVRVPFDEGALTGALTAQMNFEPGEFRAKYFARDRLTQAIERADALRPLCGDEAATLPELALRFCLSHPDVATVIPGMRRAEHVRANVAVSDGRLLTEGLRQRLAAHTWDKDWYQPVAASPSD